MPVAPRSTANMCEQRATKKDQQQAVRGDCRVDRALAAFDSTYGARARVGANL